MLGMLQFQQMLFVVGGLASSIPFGVVIREFQKRRDRHGSIKKALDLWRELPESESKDQFLRRIEKRVNDLGGTQTMSVLGRSLWASSLLAGMFFFIYSMMHVLLFIGGDYSFKRRDGILWLMGPSGPEKPFTSWCWDVWGIVGLLAFAVAVASFVGWRIDKWRKRRDDADTVDDVEEVDEAVHEPQDVHDVVDDIKEADDAIDGAKDLVDGIKDLVYDLKDAADEIGDALAK
jgi:hypothetical protein